MENNQFEEDRLIFIRQMENYLQQKLFPEAIAAAEERLAMFPLDVDAEIFLSRVLIAVDRIEEARNFLRRLEKDISGLSFVYLRAADTYLEKGLNQDAVFCYQKFISLNPLSDYAAEAAEKISLLQKEDVAPSQADESTGETDEESRPEFYTVTLADLYIKQGHLQMAADVLAEIIRQDPVNVQARVRLDTVKAAMTLKSTADATVKSSDDLITILSSWLENLNRLKKHAT